MSVCTSTLYSVHVRTYNVLTYIVYVYLQAVHIQYHYQPAYHQYHNYYALKLVVWWLTHVTTPFYISYSIEYTICTYNCLALEFSSVQYYYLSLVIFLSKCRMSCTIYELYIYIFSILCMYVNRILCTPRYYTFPYNTAQH